MASIVFKNVDPEVYPMLYTAPFMPSNPGYVVFEEYVLRGVRLGPWAGMAFSFFPFFIARGRLPFYDRPNLMYRHYLFAGLAGGYGAGMLLGIASGFYGVSQRYGVSDAMVQKSFGGDRAAAEKDAEVRLVNDALLLRRDPESLRWVRTTSLLSTGFAFITFMFFSSYRGRLFAACAGGGTGGALASILCSSGVQMATDTLTSQAAPSLERHDRLLAQKKSSQQQQQQ